MLKRGWSGGTSGRSNSSAIALGLDRRVYLPHIGSQARRPIASAGFISTTHRGSMTTSVFTELAMKQAWWA